MKKWIVVAALICLTGGAASADVSHEVVIGLEGDSTSKVESSTGADLNGKLETTNSLFGVQYTHFFTPLKDDDKPIDLRQFYQHPSTVSIGLVLFRFTDKDSTDPTEISDGKGSYGVLLLGGEYFFPTNTGVFLNMDTGSGQLDETVGGLTQPSIALKLSALELGVRQYLSQSLAVHLKIHRASDELNSSASPVALAWKETHDRSVTFLGIRGVIADVVDLMLEIGGGKSEIQHDGITIKTDIAALNAAIAAYIGKQLSLSLGIEVEEQKNDTLVAGLPAWYTIPSSTARATLAGRYWFSERFGMELPIYSETTEKKTVTIVPFVSESKYTMTNSGIGLYAAFRF